MKPATSNLFRAKSVEGLAECLGTLLFGLDAATLPTRNLESLCIEIHALSVQIDVFKLRASGAIAARRDASASTEP